MKQLRLIQKYTSQISRFSHSGPKFFDNLKLTTQSPPCPRLFSALAKMSAESNAEKKTGKSPEKRKCWPKELLDSIRNYHPNKEADKNWKEYYLKLSLEEKRKEYSCGKKYVCIDAVEGWSSYALKVKTTAKPRYEINDQLNMKISLWRGDITALEIDVICNAANNSLLGGGGVDGAIHRAAGSKLLTECSSLKGCETGDAKLTGGYKLPAKYVLHTVGPIGEKPKALASCYRTCLNLAKTHKLRTIAFPCISTGIYGYDVEKATPVVMETVRDWLLVEENSESIDKIIFCVFLKKDVEVYENNLLEFFPVDRPVPTEEQEEKNPKAKEETKVNSEKGKEQRNGRKEQQSEIDKPELKTGQEKKDSESVSELPEKKKPKKGKKDKDIAKKAKEKNKNKTKDEHWKEIHSQIEERGSKEDRVETTSL